MGDFSIQISSRLINRLTNEEEKVKRKPKKTKSKASPKPPQNQISENSKTQTGQAVQPVWPVQPPVFLPVTPPAQQPASAELEAIHSALRESERVLEKLERQEKNMVQEVTERAKDLKEKEFKLPSPKPMPCSSENSAWMNCYRQNINDPLKCAQYARSFADCARRMREQASAPETQSTMTAN